MREIKKNLNVKLPESEYNELQNIAVNMGLSLSSLIRLIIFSKLKKFRVSGNISDLIDYEN